MTPQEQYPLFYKYPHHWINAISVYKNGDDFDHKLTLAMFGEITERANWKDYAPKFKPQEGEAFLRDLEDAVNCMWVSPNIFSYKGCVLGEYHFSAGNIHIYIGALDLRIRCTSSSVSIDTAAYTRRLWELGYYL